MMGDDPSTQLYDETYWTSSILGPSSSISRVSVLMLSMTEPNGFGGGEVTEVRLLNPPPPRLYDDPEVPREAQP